MNNVAADVPFPKVDDEEIPVALDDETIEKLFELLPDYAMYIMALLLETGLREGEFYNLKWKDVDTEAVEPSLVVRKTKTGSFRVVALSSRAVEIFNHMRSGLTFSKRCKTNSRAA
jgi:integrase